MNPLSVVEIIFTIGENSYPYILVTFLETEKKNSHSIAFHQLRKRRCKPML